MRWSSKLLIALSLVLFILIAFVFPTKSSDQKMIEEGRKATGSKISIPNIEREAFAKLSTAQKEEMRFLYQKIEKEDSLNLQLYKQIAGKWFTFASPEMSGVFAEKIARHEDADSSWAIAGSTYYMALNNLEEGDLKEYCRERSIVNYENAISLAPDRMDYKISRAQIEIDYPPKENPMKGVQLLLDLNKKYPEDVKINLRLAQLGMRTGQWEKAIMRLEKVLSVDKSNIDAHCLLADAHAQLGNEQRSKEHAEQCQ